MMEVRGDMTCVLSWDDVAGGSDKGGTGGGGGK